MGSDIYWEGSQPDLILQRKMSLLVNLFFDRKKDNFPYIWFNGEVKGCFAEKDDFFEPRYTTKHLVGMALTSSFSELSYIFDNSVGAGHQIISLSEIDQANYTMGPLYWLNKSPFHYYYKPGGHYWTSSGTIFFIELWLIKRLYVPNLQVNDDYSEFKDLDKTLKEKGWYDRLEDPQERWKCVNEIFEMSIDPDNIDPKLLKRWKVDGL